MRKAIIFLVCCMTLVAAQAQCVTRNYRDVSIADVSATPRLVPASASVREGVATFSVFCLDVPVAVKWRTV